MGNDPPKSKKKALHASQPYSVIPQPNELYQSAQRPNSNYQVNNYPSQPNSQFKQDQRPRSTTPNIYVNNLSNSNHYISSAAKNPNLNTSNNHSQSDIRNSRFLSPPPVGVKQVESFQISRDKNPNFSNVSEQMSYYDRSFDRRNRSYLSRNDLSTINQNLYQNNPAQEINDTIQFIGMINDFRFSVEGASNPLLTDTNSLGLNTGSIQHLYQLIKFNMQTEEDQEDEQILKKQEFVRYTSVKSIQFMRYMFKRNEIDSVDFLNLKSSKHSQDIRSLNTFRPKNELFTPVLENSGNSDLASPFNAKSPYSKSTATGMAVPGRLGSGSDDQQVPISRNLFDNNPQQKISPHEDQQDADLFFPEISRILPSSIGNNNENNYINNNGAAKYQNDEKIIKNLNGEKSTSKLFQNQNEYQKYLTIDIENINKDQQKSPFKNISIERDAYENVKTQNRGVRQEQPIDRGGDVQNKNQNQNYNKNQNELMSNKTNAQNYQGPNQPKLENSDVKENLFRPATSKELKQAEKLNQNNVEQINGQNQRPEINNNLNNAPNGSRPQSGNNPNFQKQDGQKQLTNSERQEIFSIFKEPQQRVKSQSQQERNNFDNEANYIRARNNQRNNRMEGNGILEESSENANRNPSDERQSLEKSQQSSKLDQLKLFDYQNERNQYQNQNIRKNEQQYYFRQQAAEEQKQRALDAIRQQQLYAEINRLDQYIVKNHSSNLTPTKSILSPSRLNGNSQIYQQQNQFHPPTSPNNNFNYSQNPQYYINNQISASPINSQRKPITPRERENFVGNPGIEVEIAQPQFIRRGQENIPQKSVKIFKQQPHLVIQQSRLQSPFLNSSSIKQHGPVTPKTSAQNHAQFHSHSPATRVSGAGGGYKPILQNRPSRQSQINTTNDDLEFIPRNQYAKIAKQLAFTQERESLELEELLELDDDGQEVIQPTRAHDCSCNKSHTKYKCPKQYEKVQSTYNKNNLKKYLSAQEPDFSNNKQWVQEKYNHDSHNAADQRVFWNQTPKNEPTVQVKNEQIKQKLVNQKFELQQSVEQLRRSISLHYVQPNKLRESTVFGLQQSQLEERRKTLIKQNFEQQITNKPNMLVSRVSFKDVNRFESGIQKSRQNSEVRSPSQQINEFLDQNAHMVESTYLKNRRSEIKMNESFAVERINGEENYDEQPLNHIRDNKFAQQHNGNGIEHDNSQNKQQMISLFYNQSSSPATLNNNPRVFQPNWTQV